MTLRHWAVLGAAGAALLPAAAPAAGLDVRVLATQCSGCHAARAEVSAPVPPWQGMSEATLAAALLAFRRGGRPATVMDRLARGLTEDEIRALAAYLTAPAARR